MEHRADQIHRPIATKDINELTFELDQSIGQITIDK